MAGRAVPAASQALRVLRLLAAQPRPVPAATVAELLGAPRSSTYHLLRAMEAEGFVVHHRDEGRWGLGVAAYEVGTGYARHAPLARLGRLPLARLVDGTGESAHLVSLHGREVVYLLEDRAPHRPPLVSDVGVRLPAHLTASGRAILAAASAAQVRALFGDPDAFVDRHGVGPRTPSALREELVRTRRRGWAFEDGEVTPGFASVAVAVRTPAALPPASVAVTYETEQYAADGDALAAVVERVAATAAELARRLA